MTPSRIGKSVKFKGEIRSDEDLLIEGYVEGTISIPKNALTIGSGSEVKAEVHAHSLTLHGKLSGEATVASRIEIKKTGSLNGNLVTHRIVIEDGGIFRGTCETRKPKAAAPQKRPKRPVRSASRAKPADKARSMIAANRPATAETRA